MASISKRSQVRGRTDGSSNAILKQQWKLARGVAAAPAKVFVPSTIVGASAYHEENTSKMRQVIASRLAESIGPIPTFYLTMEIEMDNALELRKAINASVSEDQKISVNDIIVKVAALSLMKHPFANASYQDKTIRFYEQADIGVAVAIEDGLITPVIRGANLKGFLEISAEIKDLAAKARAKKLQPEEYTGATFSISNLGMFGIKEFTAIINPPEAGILAIGGAAPTRGRPQRPGRRPQHYERHDVLRPSRHRRRDRREIPPDVQANARAARTDARITWQKTSDRSDRTSR